MSTFVIPSMMTPVFDLYEISWPDVDEDKVNQIGFNIQSFGGHALIFGITVKTALKDLADASHCVALDEMAEAWAGVVEHQLQPLSDLTDHAPEVTVTAANSITAYKAALLGILTAQIGMDVLSGGVSMVVKKAVARDVIHNLMSALTHEAAVAIAQTAKNEFEASVIGPLKSYIHEAIQAATHDLKRVVVDAVPPLNVGLGESMLFVEIEEIETAISKISAAYEKLSASVKQLLTLQLSETYAELSPMPDLTVRTQVKEVMDFVGHEIEAQLDDLGQQVVDKLAESIRDVYLKFQEADQTLAEVALVLRRQFSDSAFMPPSLVEPTEEIQTIEWTTAGAPLHTGAGISGAREEIRATEWQVAGAPVQTGLADSDARDSIQDITWQRAESTTLTGLGSAEPESADRDRTDPEGGGSRLADSEAV